MEQWLVRLIEESLHFDCVDAMSHSAVTSPFSTQWRSFPCTMIAQWRQHAMLFEREEQAPILAADGDIIITPPGAWHCVSLREQGRAVCRFVHVRYTIGGALDLLSLLSITPHLSGRIAETVGDIVGSLGEVVEDIHLDPLLRNIRVRYYGYQLLEQLLPSTNWETIGHMTLVNTRRILPVLRHIWTHYHEEISRDALARLINLSAAQFHVIFKQAIGQSPMNYLIHYRMEQAQRMLMSADLSITGIAERVGYHDAFHFSRQFHALFGMSPQQYRLRVRLSSSE